MNPLLLGILTKAPELIAIAKKLVDTIKGSKKTVETAGRIAFLEKNEAQQAELVRAITKQLEDMTAVMKVMNTQIFVCLTCSVVALVLSAAALLNVLVK